MKRVKGAGSLAGVGSAHGLEATVSIHTCRAA